MGSRVIVYSLTKKGALQLENWIKQPITELAVSHDLFSLKLFFINDQNDPRIAELIDEEKALIKSQLQHLYARNYYSVIKKILKRIMVII